MQEATSPISELDVEEQGLGNFTVQVFTVSALVPAMIEEGALLDVLINNLYNFFWDVTEPNRPSESGNNTNPADRKFAPVELDAFTEVYARLVTDLKYVLRHDAVASHLMHKRNDLLQKFLDVVSILQGSMPYSFNGEQEGEVQLIFFQTALLIENGVYSIADKLAAGFEADPEGIEVGKERKSYKLQK